MTGKTFVDTNILYYAIDTNAGEKHERAKTIIRGLWESGTGILSTQVLSEISFNLRKKKEFSWEKIRQITQPYSAWNVISQDSNDIFEALRIADANQLSYWDALIVTSAVKGGALELFTEDLYDGQIIEGVTVTNPLR